MSDWRTIVSPLNVTNHRESLEASLPEGVHQLIEAYRGVFWFHEDTFHWRNSPFLHIIPITASVLYVAMVYLLPGYLIRHNYKFDPRTIKPLMAAWNLFLSVLSGMMFFGLLVPAIDMMWMRGVWTIVCNPHMSCVEPYGTVATWAALFGWMKFAELMDTVFMILKNPERPIPFLHWYHHFTVLIFTWYAANWNLSIGWEFAIVNSAVHMFMYWYYFQMERGIRPWWAKPLTVGQILQMVFGLFLNCLWFYGYKNGYHCSCTQPDVLIAMGVTIYASYLFLFSKYFVERYIFVTGAAGKKALPPKQPQQQKPQQQQQKPGNKTPPTKKKGGPKTE